MIIQQNQHSLCYFVLLPHLKYHKINMDVLVCHIGRIDGADVGYNMHLKVFLWLQDFIQKVKKQRQNGEISIFGECPAPRGKRKCPSFSLCTGFLWILGQCVRPGAVEVRSGQDAATRLWCLGKWRRFALPVGSV
mgnify:FL=1